MKVLTDYLMTLGWAVVCAIAMAIALVLLVRVFTWLTPIDEWDELRQGNVAAVAIVVGVVVIAFALVVAAAIPSPSLPR